MARPPGVAEETGPGDEQHGQQEQAGAAEAGRHDAFGGLARVEHALAEHRVGGIPDAGRHGKGDAGRVDRCAAVAREQHDAHRGEGRGLGPARAQPLAVDQAPEHPGRGGAGADGDHGATATPVSLTAAKKDSW